MKLIAKGPNQNMPVLVQVMAWCKKREESLYESITLNFTDIHAHSGSMS